MEEIIASDIRLRNEKLSEKYIHKFIDKLGSIEEIPNGEYSEAFQYVSLWEKNDECILPNNQTESLMNINNSL